MSEPSPLTAEHLKGVLETMRGGNPQLGTAFGGSWRVTADAIEATLDAARAALAAAQTDAAHWCEKYDGALGKLAAAERTAEVRLTVTNATLARERELLGRIATAVALAEARVALAALRSRFGPPIDYADPVYQMLHDADTALAMTDAGALEALRERVRAEAFEEGALKIEEMAERATNSADEIEPDDFVARRATSAYLKALDHAVIALRALAGGRKPDTEGK